MTAHRLYAITPTAMIEIPLRGIVAIGGTNSSGVALEGLKQKDDYAIVGPGPDGMTVHPLRGGTQSSRILGAHVPLVIEDLTFVALPGASIEQSENATATPFHSELTVLMREFSEKKDLESCLGRVLTLAMRLSGHQKGLIISKNLSGQFQVISSHHLNQNDPWLSESLLQKALNDKVPVLLQNIVGTGFDLNRSLVSTGFMSVHCWPLLIRGESVGCLVTGSQLPQGELESARRSQLEMLMQAAALFLRFHLDDLRLKEEILSLRQRVDDSPFLTQSPELQETLRLAGCVSASDLSVLIQGETGVGKEVMARFLHDRSDRARAPFIAVNCGAIPSELLESLLFGHKRGAFTGAISDQVGKFQQADGGTLFLDEIGEMPAALQVKLLRVLQEKSVEPLGSTKSIRVDVRAVSASHKSIYGLVKSGGFREDLYYRLAEMTLRIPALRERPADVPLLAAHFLREMAPEKRLGESAWQWLTSQPWKGNVRELRSAIKRAALLAQSSEITVREFQTGTFAGASSGTGMTPEKEWLGGRNLEEAKHVFVQDRIAQALLRTNGNRTRAAELLGVTPRTLFRYLEDRPSMTEPS